MKKDDKELRLCEIGESTRDENVFRSMTLQELLAALESMIEMELLASGRRFDENNRNKTKYLN